MRKIKVGVMGVYRGSSMIHYCERANNAEVVALCDKWKEGLEAHKESYPDSNITYYNNFDEFIKHDMDAVVLANYANEHAPFAIKALKAGKHVFSEVLPCQTMKEAVELIEAVEESGLIYAYGENYCYMPAPLEMKKLYEEGKIGELEFAECEYLHNCESIWPSIAYGDPNHWRNNMYSTFYCTHSLGPIIHVTGLRPVSVIGFETPLNERANRMGHKGAGFGIEMVTLENGGIVRSAHGGTYKDSIWYWINGSKGVMESAREMVKTDSGVHKLYLKYDEYSGGYNTEKYEAYEPVGTHPEESQGFGHGGSDFYSMYHFIEKIKGTENADIIDVYEAMDMYLPGMFAFRSILKGSVPVEIPNLRNKEEREKWRNDVACVYPEIAGDQLLPHRKGGTPEIDPKVYEYQKMKWEEALQDKNSGHLAAALNSGKKKK